VSLFVALHDRFYWLAVLLVLVASHLMHGAIIGFHEASHGLLRKNRKLNELDGIVLGMLSFTSFSLYRAAHQTHHAHLGTERDEELWPFVKPGMPRWFRVLAAAAELSCGLLFTPLIFLRSFLRKDSPIRSKKVRRRIWAEFALIAVFWTAVVCAVTAAGAWKYFLWMYVAPAWIAGNLQSWRKYVEHVGLTGSTVRSATRSIVADNAWGKLVSFTLLHEPYHGVHHQRVGLPHAELPAHADELQPANAEEYPPFKSYGHAARHLMHCLTDPRVGAQWQRAKGSSAHPKPDARVSTADV
jgi:fatty acid desaturase